MPLFKSFRRLVGDVYYNAGYFSEGILYFCFQLKNAWAYLLLGRAAPVVAA